MDSFRLTPKANLEMERILLKLERDEGVHVAQHVEAAFFEAFHELAQLPQIGHRREGLGKPDERFHNVFRYVIVFRREPRVVILRVIHGARDLPRKLQ